MILAILAIIDCIKEDWKKKSVSSDIFRFYLYPVWSSPGFIMPYLFLSVQSVAIYVGVHHFQWRVAAFVLS